MFENVCRDNLQCVAILVSNFDYECECLCMFLVYHWEINLARVC